jgi:hypothetical protein
MSCFWDGLRGKVHALSKLKTCQVRDALKAANVLTKSVTFNGERLTDARLQENYDWVKRDMHPWNGGHDTSSADPYLGLVSELFCINIHFDFAGHVQRIEHPKATVTVHFAASRTHFS